jgi:hypothetical protein
MKRKIITFLSLSAAMLIACNLPAQVNAPPGDPVLQERLQAVAQDQLVDQQADPGLWGESVDDYCIPGANCSFGDGFTDFTFAGIENLGSGCSAGGYGDFTTMQGSAEIGQAYTASFATGYADQMVSMWIDFNDDEVFSEMERILTDFNLPAAGMMYDVDITIPGFAAPGVHRMRIGANWIDPSSPDPCATLTYGEWEDYMMEITGDPISLNVGVASIDMATVMLAGDIIPVATVANYGVETVSFPVTMTSSTNGYESTVEVVDLAIGESVQVEFDTWTVEVGSYDAEVCTDLDGDEMPDNDCQTISIAFSDQPRQKVVAEFFTGTW